MTEHNIKKGAQEDIFFVKNENFGNVGISF